MSSLPANGAEGNGGAEEASHTSSTSSSFSHVPTRSTSGSIWLTAPLTRKAAASVASSPASASASAHHGTAGSASLSSAAYDRKRMGELVRSSPHSLPASAHPLLHASKNALYTSALAQLATELAKVNNVAWNKISRLCALCPPVPPLSVSPALSASWAALTAAFHKQMHPRNADELEQGYEEDEDEDEDEVAAAAEEEEENCISRGSLQWEYAPSKLPLLEAMEPLDARVEGIWSLTRYLISAQAAGESARASHLGRLLPILLRFLLSLPYVPYDAANFPSVTPQGVTHTTLNLLAELGQKVPQSRRHISQAMLLLLKSCTEGVLPTDQQTTDRKSDVPPQHGAAVLEGVLSALGDQPFPLRPDAASELSEQLHRLFLAKYSLTPLLYGLTLRATTALLARSPDVFNSKRLNYLFEHEFMRCTFKYPEASSMGSDKAHTRRSSLHGSMGGGGMLSGPAVAASAQSLILVQSIHIGVLVGLISVSHSGPHGVRPNCSVSEEESYRERALSKLKLLLDQLLNVKMEAPAATTKSDGSSAPSSSPPASSPTSSSSSSSVPALVPQVVIGCVEASRAILNGVTELAFKYAADGQSIPHIVDALRSILLHSRRLSTHPKQKQIRYQLTLALSKLFKLELTQTQEQPDTDRPTTAAARRAMGRSTSSQSLGEFTASSLEDGVAAGRTRSHTTLSPQNQGLKAPKSMRPSGAHTMHALNNRSGMTPSPQPAHTPAPTPSPALQMHLQFSNTFTRSFVQGLLTQLYKEDNMSTSHLSSSISLTPDRRDSSAMRSAQSSLVYPRLLTLLLDLVSLIDHAPLTQLVLPSMLARLTTKPMYMHLVLQQLTDVAIMEERRYAQNLIKEQQAQSASSSTPPPVRSGFIPPDLKIFDGILSLFLFAYGSKPSSTTDADASSSSTRKTLVELPGCLLRLSKELQSAALKKYMLKRLLRLILEMSNEIRNEELALAQRMAELAKSKKKGKVDPEVHAHTQAALANNANRTEACGFLLPILATLMKECYMEQVQQAATNGTPSSTPTIGLQLYSTPESNVKWFRRLWFFLTSFHFTDALVGSTTGSSGVGPNSPLLSGGGSSSGVSVGERWSESLKQMALYSPVLVNLSNHLDTLSTELAREYEGAFKKVVGARSRGSTLSGAVNTSLAQAGAAEVPMAVSEKVSQKLNQALADSYRKQLQSLLPASLSYDLNNLAMGRVLFLLSVMHMETIRLKATCGQVSSMASYTDARVVALQPGSSSMMTSVLIPPAAPTAFHALFAYLSHYPLARMDLLKFVQAFGENTVLPLVVRLVFRAEHTPARQVEMEEVVTYLLRQLASRITVHRNVALQYLTHLTRSHVHLQWSARCISTLLELMHILHESLDTSVALDLHKDKTAALFPALAASAPSNSPSLPPPVASMSGPMAGPLNELTLLKSQLDLPDDLVQRQLIHATLLQLASGWLHAATTHVPEQTHSVVQEFMQRVQRNSRRTGHTSFHASLNLLLTSVPSSAPTPTPSANGDDSTLSRLLVGLSLKERYMGEMKGLYRSYQEAMDRKRREWREAMQKGEVDKDSLRKRRKEVEEVQQDEEEEEDKEDGDARPSFMTARSMSILIQEESAEAFRNLLSRRAHARAANSAATAASTTTPSPSSSGPPIAPFGRLLTAKFVLEGTEILSSFTTIHATMMSRIEEGGGAEEVIKAARAEKEEKLAALHARLERLLCLTAALLVWSAHARSSLPDLAVDSQELLHLLVKTPSQLFTTPALEAGVFVWEWLLGADPQFQLPLLIEMKAAWGYTVDRQVGLFSHRRQAKSKEIKDVEKKLPLAKQTEENNEEQEEQEERDATQRKDSASTRDQPSSQVSRKDSTDDREEPPPKETIHPGSKLPSLKTGLASNLVRPSAVVQGGAAAGGEAAAATAAAAAPADSLSGASFQFDMTAEAIIQPHLLWVNFLLRYFHYLPAFSRDSLNILAAILHKSFARPDLLSSSDKSFGCRFRLLYLGIRLVQQGSPTSSSTSMATSGPSVSAAAVGSVLEWREQQLLRERIYHAALHWFQTPAIWNAPSTPSQLQEDAQIVLDLCSCLHKEEQFWQQQLSPLDKATERALAQQDDASYPLEVVASAAAIASSASSTKQRLDQLTKQRNLLVFLLSHELDRMQAWHWPLSSSMSGTTPGAVQPRPSQFTTRRNMYAPEWRTLLSTAWTLSPRLCVRLSQRFEQNSIVVSEVRRLVQAHPERVYDLPEAVSYLVTEETVRQAAHSPSSSVLRHLIYWTPCSLPQALTFLCAPLCQSRLVLEYAVHTLRSHPPENVMFYLPQLIQSLRRDSPDKLLYTFLLDSSQRSVLLSHQLLWLLQAELGEVKPDTPYVHTPFRAICEQLSEEVIARFDPVERTFYQQEVHFFEQITAISGILKPLPTKAERKEKIRQELLKIHRPTPNIYLPTNPQLQVVDIIPTSGAPMQSAAKVPILVAFKVRVGELDLSKERAQLHMRRTRALSFPPKDRASASASHINTITEGARGEDRLIEVIDEEKAGIDTRADGQDADGAGEESGERDGAERVSIRVNGTEISQSDVARPVDEGLLLTAGGGAGEEAEGGEGSMNSSRLEDDIELLVESELSQSAGDVTHQLNTALARNKAARLAAAKSMADAQGVLVQACIFKVGDDCRQDALALQVIQWCKNIFQANGLELYLYPYRVLPNRTGKEGLIGGIIECVPNSATRDEIGKATACSLKDYFISRFGPPESAAFQKAQRNFIVSCAGYAVVSFLLQVKDRHNGNLMLDSSGHMTHIDFGFIFDISPAKDLKFESAGFKLTLEMLELMGSDGKTEGPLVTWFMELVIRGFLAVREQRAELVAIVEPMLASTLTCFKPHSLAGLKGRFFPDRDEQGAAEAMLGVVTDAWNKWTTNVYDMIQKAQQNVFYFKGTSASDPEKRIKISQEELDE